MILKKPKHEIGPSFVLRVGTFRFNRTGFKVGIMVLQFERLMGARSIFVEWSLS